MRTCVGCGEKHRKVELMRVVFNGRPQLDVSQSEPGRGAYLCGLGCLPAAMKVRGFSRAWRSSGQREVKYAGFEHEIANQIVQRR